MLNDGMGLHCKLDCVSDGFCFPLKNENKKKTRDVFNVNISFMCVDDDFNKAPGLICMGFYRFFPLNDL